MTKEKGRRAIIADVTAEDIANGHRRKGTSCPIALALNRATNGDSSEVDYNNVDLYIEGEGFFYGPVTERANRFMTAFDAGHKVEPTRLRFIVA